MMKLEEVYMNKVLEIEGTLTKREFYVRSFLKVVLAFFLNFLSRMSSINDDYARLFSRIALL